MLLDVGSLNRPRFRSNTDKGDLARMNGQVSKFQGYKVSKFTSSLKPWNVWNF